MVSSIQHVPCLKRNQLNFELEKIAATYINTDTTAMGMRKISENAMSRKMLRCWNSTSEIIKRAPHQLFWPIIYEINNKNEEKTSVNCTATIVDD